MQMRPNEVAQLSTFQSPYKSLKDKGIRKLKAKGSFNTCEICNNAGDLLQNKSQFLIFICFYFLHFILLFTIYILKFVNFTGRLFKQSQREVIQRFRQLHTSGIFLSKHLKDNIQISRRSKHQNVMKLAILLEHYFLLMG